MSAFEIWTAGEMLAGMCARFGRAGRFPHLGEFRFLFYHVYLSLGMFVFLFVAKRSREVVFPFFCFWLICGFSFGGDREEWTALGSFG